jgi:hypothetical protein
MGDIDDQRHSVKPTEQRGGTTPSDDEAREKGPWAAKAAEGVVPAALGGSNAPADLQADDPDLGSSVLGMTTGSDEPATEAGVDLDGGDHADATSHGGPAQSEADEPDLKDAAAGPRQSDLKSAKRTSGL